MTSEWTVDQHLVLDRMAGALSVAELVEEIALHGPRHGERSVVQQAAVSRVSLRRRRRRHAWTDDEDTVLRELAGRATSAEITAALRRRCLFPRTEAAVRWHAMAIGVSLDAGPTMLGLFDLRAILTVKIRTIYRWVTAGYLHPDRRGSGNSGSEWRFRSADVEAFIDMYGGWLLDWRQVRPGPWQQRARAAAARDAWVSTEQAAQALGLRPSWVRERAGLGHFPGAVRVGKVWRIPLSSLPVAQVRSA